MLQFKTVPEDNLYTSLSPLFSLLKSEIIWKIRFACIFGSSSNRLIFVTYDDDVYGIGDNSNGCLGLGSGNFFAKETKISILCQKRVIKIIAGFNSSLALTEDGHIYSWGQNNYGQLGNGSTNQLISPTLITKNLGKKICDICSSFRHTLALTDDGKIYTWGVNNFGELGSGTTTHHYVPRQILSTLSDIKISAILCSNQSSYAISEGKTFYCWGYNGYGELGLGHNNNQLTPVVLTSTFGIKKVVCGLNHVLILDGTGSVYSFGYNAMGQLGVKSLNNSNVPMRLNISETIVDVLATQNLSACLCKNGDIFVWGHFLGQNLSAPKKLDFKSFAEIPVAASKTVAFERVERPISLISMTERDTQYKILDCLEKAFNCEEFSDIRFIIGGKAIHVHKTILKLRCDYFKSRFNKEWDSANTNQVEVEEFSFEVYYAFLKFLYTERVSCTLKNAIGLLELADTFCENDLKSKCLIIIKNGLKVENFADIYSASIKFKADQLEDHCFEFALKHLTPVVQSDIFPSLEETTKDHFFLKASQHGAFKT